MQIEIEYIFAVNDDGIIGIDNRLPWYIPEDLAYFRKMTFGNIIIMGRKTFESIPDSVLQGRIVIVLSRTEQHPEHLRDRISKYNIHYTTLDRCFDILREMRREMRVFVIGGADMFQIFYPYTNRIFITKVDCSIPEITLNIVRLPFTLTQIETDFYAVNCGDILKSRTNIPYQFLEYKRICG